MIRWRHKVSVFRLWERRLLPWTAERPILREPMNRPPPRSGPPPAARNPQPDRPCRSPWERPSRPRSGSWPAARGPQRARSAGFTLTELVIVIALTGIIAAVMAVFITRPIQGYQDVSERAALVNAAEMALRRMEREIRNALPNSVDLNGSTNLRIINTVDGGRYRDGPGQTPGGTNANQPQHRLQFNQADDEFNLLGRFANIPATRPVSDAGWRLVIYNTGQPGANAYAGDAVLSPPGLTLSDDNGEDHVLLTTAHQFPYESPQQRLYLVDRMISYHCTGGQLLRQTSTDITGGFPAPGGALLAEYLSACAFEYDPGTATRGGLVTIELGLTHGGETVTLLHQIHVDNAP